MLGLYEQEALPIKSMHLHIILHQNVRKSTHLYICIGERRRDGDRPSTSLFRWIH